jgi:hypothetical protein
LSRASEQGCQRGCSQLPSVGKGGRISGRRAGAAARAGLVLAALSACRGSEHAPELGLAPSFLPNLGLAATGSAVVGRSATHEWRAETRFTYQFLDDKDLADNGFPPAGDWTQLELGLRADGPSEERLRWSWRFGAVGFRAHGEPNIVEEPGDYYGLYAGVGRFADLGRGFSFGPELTLIAATGPDPRVLIPQITWGVRWCPR